MSYQWVALVPMRHTSERVPGKNYRQLAGRPLYAHILEALSQVQAIERIVVDTDSPVIQAGLAEDFPEVLVLDRPEALRGGEVPMNAVIRHDLEQVPSYFYVQTHSTNPLLRAETIERSIQRFNENLPAIDSLFSVTGWQTRLWTVDGVPINHDPDQLLRTQDMEVVYQENSCLYLFGRDTMLESGRRIGRSPLLFEIDRIEAIDIDNEADFQLVKAVLDSFPNGFPRGMS
jgi:CMP-N-acetylneuraminic acid synthetase